MRGQEVLDVVEHMVGLAECADFAAAHVRKLAVAHGDDDGVVAGGFRLRDGRDAVFVPGLVGVHAGVIDVHLGAVGGEVGDDVHHAGVAHVGAVFLEGEAHDEDTRAGYGDAFPRHQLHHLRRHVETHVVVDAPAGKDHFGVVAQFLRLVREVVGVHADAVPAHEARSEGQEVPLGARGGKHFLGVDADAVADEGEFVD